MTQSRKGWQAAGCRGTEHISTDISLLRVGLGPPVSACALPWANSDRNACPNSVPGEPASQPDGLIGLPCPSPIPNQPLLCPLVLADQCARPFQGVSSQGAHLALARPPCSDRRSRGSCPHQAGRWGKRGAGKGDRRPPCDQHLAHASSALFPPVTVASFPVTEAELPTYSLLLPHNSSPGWVLLSFPLCRQGGRSFDTESYSLRPCSMLRQT